MIEEFPAVASFDEGMPAPQEEAASVLEQELYGTPGADFPEATMTAEEAQTLAETPSADVSSSTVMFRANDVHWPPAPADAPPPRHVDVAPAHPADAVPAFDEVFEAELQAGVSEAPGEARGESFGSTIPFASHTAPPPEPEPEPVFDLAAGPARPEPPSVAAPVAVAPAALPDLPEEISFAEVAAAPAAKPIALPSAAAEVAVPVDMVAQIAQRVVSQISEKMVREVAWEVIPDLAEALIKKEIERLKAELQNT